MNIYPIHTIREIEKLTCEKQNLTHLDLINRAGAAFADAFLIKVFEKRLPVIILAGNGNNGADAIVAANVLASKGIEVILYCLHVNPIISSNFEEMSKRVFTSVRLMTYDPDQFDAISLIPECYIIDGILGSGLNRALEPALQGLLRTINANSAIKVAVDIPTGVGADGTLYEGALKCDHTIGLGSLKLAYFLYYEEDHIGKFHFCDLGFEKADQISDGIYVDRVLVKSELFKANRYAHKFLKGSVLMVGGQYGMVGCMRLAGEAALRSGCGLVTLHVPKCAVEFLQGSLPEALIEPDENFYSVGLTQDYKKFNALGIGPGMGQHTKQIDLVRRLLFNKPHCPMVWDADALKILGLYPEFLSQLPANTILTPHMGEFTKLFGRIVQGKELHKFALAKAKEYQIIIILKGPDTISYLPDGNYFVNSTGNYGMATAGSGDVLTGIVTGLLAQGYIPAEAARIGVFIHGLAGDLAAIDLGHSSLIASDIIKYLGHAFLSLNAEE